MRRIVLILLLFYASNYSFTQDWIRLRKGIPPPNNLVLTIEENRNELFVVGTIFNDGEGNELRGITRWDGSHFEKYAHGMPYTPKSFHVYRYNDTLYVSSYLEVEGKYTLAYYHEVLDSFITIPNKILYGPVFSSLEVNDTLYLSGIFTKCGTDTTWGFCMFDGVLWHSIFSQGRPEWSADNFDDFIFYKNKLYVGGNFLLPDTDSNLIDDLAILENGELHEFGGGLGFTGLGFISAFAILHDELYIAGYFISANGIPVRHIVKWNGNQFYDVGGGADGYINDMIVYNDNLYVCGGFNYVGGVYAPNIARWDGNNWHGFTYDNFTNGTSIHDMQIYNEELYITGTFLTINNDTFNCIAKYRYKLPGQIGNNLEIFINNPGEEIIIQYENSNEYSLGVGIFTVSGQQVGSYLFPNQKGYIHQSIPIPGLASGVYIVTAIAGDKKLTKKLLKVNQ